MESSRIFVRGLPPNLSADEFMKHFSKQSAVTDVKFIPHRRIGYVGYRTPEDAAKAVNYHNKTFIRMSRIFVELARSVQSQSAVRVVNNFANGSKEGDGKGHEEIPREVGVGAPKKRKRGAPPEVRDETKLQEFLQVMQPPSKFKTWENQDVTATWTSTDSVINAAGKGFAKTRGDEAYESAPKKQERERDVVRKELRVLEPPKVVGATGQERGTVDAPEMVIESRQETSGNVEPSSDADWLRSRTSRLLGLVDHDDVPGQTTSPGDNGAKNPEPDLKHFQSRGVSDESVQKDEQEDEDNIALETLVQDREDVTVGNGRLFVRNLTYTATEDELREYFKSGAYGTIEEVRLPIDFRSGQNKGFAHVQYREPEAAVNALKCFDQSSFQGRLLHVIPADSKKESTLDNFAISKLPFRKQQQIKRKAEAATSTFNWNSMYMDSDAVMSSISARLGVSKYELLDPTSSGAAVNQAQAETHIILETKSYFTANGVDLEAFRREKRGNTVILVKNFSYGTKPEELQKVFEAYGPIRRMLMPPAGTIAIVEYVQPDHAQSAFGSLAYRKFKDSILFLEKAPEGIFTSDRSGSKTQDTKIQTVKPSVTDLLSGDGDQQPANTSTLFIRNLNFSTTTERLREIFKPLDGFLSARVKTKPDPKKPGQLLSMGFGFLEFGSKKHAHAALAAMDGYELDGHELLIRASHKAIDAAEERRNEDYAKKVAAKKTKIIIKNLPFEASKKDVQSLFRSYGKLRSVRVPKKFDSSTRGFAFAEFVTAREAENALDALKNTHFLGRRLVLEFAAEDPIDAEQEIEKMQQKVGKQADKVALQKLSGSGRKKFNVEGVNESDQG